MPEKIDCLLNIHHNIYVRISKLKQKAYKIRCLIMEEEAIESRQNAAKQP